MSSDRARISFDPSRSYRGVVSQQGRVTVEADANEALAIATAQRRAELLDVVGPSGTPDDGYKVLAGASGAVAGDLSVQAGTFYVGGERVVLTQQLDYANQPDWVDTGGDPLWVAPAVPSDANEVVYLFLREQEVSAIEDPALIDIALGGPDTAARQRIVQRIVRASTTATDAADALAALEQDWSATGLAFDAGTMRLRSQATLQVGFGQQPGIANLCQPSGQGGYVGAENQLIRVQVASVSGGQPTLVWGFDNASYMYRVSGAQTPGATVLALSTAPVDSYHQPALGQAVEVLQAAAALNPSDTSDYIAATTGTVTTLTAPYDPTSGQVQLATGLTADEAASPLLFLRVWEETIAYSGGPVALGQTGLQVTLTNSGGAWHVGDYWTFAVRPGTPTTLSPVYPERIVASPQPPDGPELWAAQLALVSWSGGAPTILDLRNNFQGLVTLTEQAKGCCTVEITPDAVNGGSGLQALIDSYANIGPTTICFQPGTYTLPAPLTVQAGVSALTLEACMGGVVIEAADNSAPFTLGLIVAESAVGATNGGSGTTSSSTPGPTPSATTAAGTGSSGSAEAVAQSEDVAPFTVRGLVLSMPPVPFPYSPSAISGLPAQRQALLTDYGNGLQVSFGISVFGCSNVTIEQCRFYFPDVASTNLFAAGIYATGTTAGVQVADCSFLNAPEPTSVPFSDMRLGTFSAPPYQACFGYLQMPTQPPPASTATTSAIGAAQIAIPPDIAEAAWRDVPLAEGAVAAAFEAPSVTERVEGHVSIAEEVPATPAPTSSSRPKRQTKAGTTKAGTTKAGTTRAGTTKAGSARARTTKAGTTKPATTKAGTTKPGTTKRGNTKAGTVRAASRPTYSRRVPTTTKESATADPASAASEGAEVVAGEGATTIPGDAILFTTPHFTLGPPTTTVSGGTTVTPTTTSSTTAGPTTTSGPPPPLTLSDAVLEDAVFARNTFDGLTVPVLVLAQIGVVSVTDNTVRACYGGFWFVPADGDTAVALLDLLDSTDTAASDYAVQYGITALTDPVLWLATALARLLPLTPPTTTAPVLLRPIALPVSLLTNVATLLHTLSAAALATTPGTSPSGPATAAEDVARAVIGERPLEGGLGGVPEVGVAGRLTDIGARGLGPIEGIGVIDTPEGETGLGAIDVTRTPILRLPNFGDLIGQLGQVTPLPPPPIPSADMGLGTTPRLDFHGNEVEAIIEATYSGVGLLVAVMLTDGTAVSVICNGNRIRARVSSGPSVSLNQVTECTMTGNLISNEIVDPSATSSPEPSITPSGASGSSQTAGSETPTTTSPSVVLEPAMVQPPTPASGGAPAPIALVAVTGNVLIGDPPTLPARPAQLPAGFAVWDVLNTIVYYVLPPPPTTTTATTTTTAPS